MPRKLITLLFVLFSVTSFAKTKGVFEAELGTSTDKSELITVTGKFKSQMDFEYANIEWKFEGDIEHVSGRLKTTVNEIKANQENKEEISIRIKNPDGAKVIFWVYTDVDGVRYGTTQIYTPAAAVAESQGHSKKLKTYQIKSKKIFH
jgi:hypothetical protein